MKSTIIRVECYKIISILFLVGIFGLSGCANPYIYPGSASFTTPSLKSESALMSDGFSLPLTVWHASGKPHAIVLALHGLNDYRQAFKSSGEFLSNQGISVYAYDQRGFGETEGTQYWHGSRTLISDLQAMLTLLRQAYPDQPIYIMGESMGGAVTLAAQSVTNLIADGLILIAPAVWSRDNMPWYQRLLLWSAVHTLPGKRLTGKGLDIKPTDNIEMLRAWARDPLVIKATRVDVLYGVTNLMDLAAASAHKLQSDALLLYGEHDDIIPREPTCQLVKAITNQSAIKANTIIYDKGYHMLTRDLHAELVLQDIAGWILSKRSLKISHQSYCSAIAEQGAS
jgi:alpha-beta hydrolase superfamily lysophospholipase